MVFFIARMHNFRTVLGSSDLKRLLDAALGVTAMTGSTVLHLAGPREDAYSRKLEKSMKVTFGRGVEWCDV